MSSMRATPYVPVRRILSQLVDQFPFDQFIPTGQKPETLQSMHLVAGDVFPARSIGYRWEDLRRHSFRLL